MHCFSSPDNNHIDKIGSTLDQHALRIYKFICMMFQSIIKHTCQMAACVDTFAVEGDKGAGV